MEKPYTVSKNKTWSCGSDPQLLMEKFRLKLKKTGKTTRPVRHDINKIPNDYTVEVMNRFKGLDPKNSGQRFVTLYMLKSSPRKRNVRRQSGCLRRAYK